MISATTTIGVWRARGFTILESLVTVVILAFGVLGLAGLQTKLQLAEVDSFQRSQAIVLLDDMAARLNANRTKAVDYAAFVQANGPIGTGDSEPGLAACAALAIGLERDVCEWSNALKGSSEQKNGNVGAMTGGRGCIDQVAGADPPSFVITVAWQGMNKVVAPGLQCAAGLYDAQDQYRRAISKVVSIATLTPP